MRVELGSPAVVGVNISPGEVGQAATAAPLTTRFRTSPTLLHVLSPKFLSIKARPLGKTESR